MKVIIEGRLKFTFSEDCHVSKYDKWSFYGNQFQKTCGSAKAVDIVCVTYNTTWLIEIKDYRAHPRTKSEDIGDEIAIKVRDTLAGLVAAKVNANDHDEKQFATLALQDLKSIRVVLHLEQPAKHSKLFPKAINPANVKQKLKQRLSAIDAHPLVVDHNSLTTHKNWTVDDT